MRISLGSPQQVYLLYLWLQAHPVIDKSSAMALRKPGNASKFPVQLNACAIILLAHFGEPRDHHQDNPSCCLMNGGDPEQHLSQQKSSTLKYYDVCYTRASIMLLEVEPSIASHLPLEVPQTSSSRATWGLCSKKCNTCLSIKMHAMLLLPTHRSRPPNPSAHA